MSGTRSTNWMRCLIQSAVVAIPIALVVGCGNPPSSTNTGSAVTAVSSSVPSPQAPADSCTVLSNRPTGHDIETRYGHYGFCDPGSPIILQTDGNGTQPAGFLICDPQSGGPCGAANAQAESTQSYIDHWVFYPFPTAHGQLSGNPVWPQEYQCITDGSNSWAFHFDTKTYTSGCPAAPPENGISLRPCDAFEFSVTRSTAPLYKTYGHPAACSLFGSTIVGMMNGRPIPGVLTCDGLPGTTPSDVSLACGFNDAVPASARWSFTALPVAAGPVSDVTFDQQAGTVCISIGAQSFTFALASMSVGAGCTSSPTDTTAP